jgi:hypothetical protein
MSKLQYLWAIAVIVGGTIIISIFKGIYKWYWSKTKVSLELSPWGPGGSNGIHAVATWKRGRQTCFRNQVVVHFKKLGRTSLTMTPDFTTIGPSNLTHIFDMGANPYPYPLDDLRGIGMQDERGRWHYSKGFPWIERSFWLPSRIYRFREWRRIRKLRKGM